jgi:hypothetical protein
MSLKVTLSTDSAAYQKGMKDAMQTGKDFESSLKKIGAAAGAYLSFSAVKGGVETLITSLRTIGEAAERVGMEKNIKEFQQLNYAARQSGAGVEQLETGFKKMLDTIGGALNGDGAAKSKINGIGVAVADLKGKNPAQQFDIIAAAIRGIQDPALRTSALIDIFGKSGTSLAPMIQDLDALKNEAIAVGVVIDEKLIAAAKRAEDQMDALGMVLMATAANAGLVEYLKEVAEGLNAVATNANKIGAIGGRKKGFWEQAAEFGADMVTFGNKDNIANALGLGDKLTERYNVTDEEKKKLADFKAKKEAAGGKTKTELKAEEAVTHKAVVEAEKQANSLKMVQDSIASMQQANDLQDKKNAGLSIEGERLKAIAELNKKLEADKRTLNDAELKQINEVFEKRKQLADAEKKKKVNDGMVEKAADLRDKLLRESGQGLEAEKEKLRREFEQKKGSALSQDELDRVDKLAAISDKLNNMPAMQKLESEQSNSLARVGGFTGSVRSVDLASINQNILAESKRHTDLLQQATQYMKDWGKVQ